MLLIDILSDDLGFAPEAQGSMSFSTPMWMESGIDKTQQLGPKAAPQKISISKGGASNTKYFSHRENLLSRQYRNDLGVQLSSAPEAYAVQNISGPARIDDSPISPNPPRGRGFVF